jgi:hypothetical protein
MRLDSPKGWKKLVPLELWDLAETKQIKMPSRNFEATMNVTFPMPILLAGILLPFVMGYADTSFLVGFFLSALIFMTTFTLKLENAKSDEDEKESEEPEVQEEVQESHGLAFYLRDGCIEVRTQDGRSYRWVADKDGLNYMAKGGLKSGVYHTLENLAFLEFWESDTTHYQAPLNPYSASTDVEGHVKDFQVVV